MGTKVEVRCDNCGRRLFDVCHDTYGCASIQAGSLSIKCSKCRGIMLVDFRSKTVIATK